jgi:hypothetical protein
VQAVVSFRNDKKQTAKELAAKGLQCQTQMIQAYAAIQEAIFVAKPVRMLPRGGARNGPRAAGANRHGEVACLLAFIVCMFLVPMYLVSEFCLEGVYWCLACCCRG